MAYLQWLKDLAKQAKTMAGEGPMRVAPDVKLGDRVKLSIENDKGDLLAIGAGIISELEHDDPSPRAGNIVIYHDESGVNFPALVLFCHEDEILTLAIFGGNKTICGHPIFPNPDGDLRPKTWHWPGPNEILFEEKP